MLDVFVSYARSDVPRAKRVADALGSAGFRVWSDDELPAHRAYARVIEEQLKSAKAVVVLWSAEAAKSEWVRSEADAARHLGTIVQATVDGSIPPMPFDQIQCADLTNWDGEIRSPGWRKLAASVEALARVSSEGGPPTVQRKQRVSICILPFQNMSGDSEQEYFSDGISEDITTDLSKISALAVTARNTAFQFKGQRVDVSAVARKLGTSHILEGSVRKAGDRLRITAQLVDGATGDHIWAERYDRELTDIFAIQDEISHAIVDALQVRLLPQEKSEIESRGTNNADAYNLYLMARQLWVGGTFGSIRRDESVARLCEQATLLDPAYANAWALMSLAQLELHFVHGRMVDAQRSADRALELNPRLAVARCVKARYLEEQGKTGEAEREIQTALALEPDLWEANREAGRMLLRNGHFEEAIPHLEKAAALMDSDWSSARTLISCYTRTGNRAQLKHAVKMAILRTEQAITKDPANGAALTIRALALAMSGDREASRDLVRKALLLDGDNPWVVYNVASWQLQLGDESEALRTIEALVARLTSTTILRHIRSDPLFDSIRAAPRFARILASAKVRLRLNEAR